MTRAEFAGHVKKYIKWAGFGEQDDLLDWANKKPGRGELSVFWRRIADVATNGFDPEPTLATSNTARAIDPMVASSWKYPVAAGKTIEQSQEAAKRSRPFVGSHKLPFDSDWD